MMTVVELGARTALLLALARGPGFGLELISNLAQLSNGLLRLNRGGAYLALRHLERQGLVRGWMRHLPRSGRPRRYYELTPEGILRAEELSAALAGVARASATPVSEQEAMRMADRVKEASDLSVFAMRLRDAGREAGL
jgi:PadR family transcriptional regulator PadR